MVMTSGEQLLAVVAVVIATTTTTSFAEPAASDEARSLVKRGVEHYERGEIDLAIEALERAQKIEMTAQGCYALGQALRKNGACERAIPMYRCAVERAPSEEFARAANYQLGRCVVESGIDRRAEPSPEVTGASSLGVKRETPAPVAPWYSDTAGGILLGLGLSAAGIGGGLLVHAEFRASSAGDDLMSFRDADSVGTERLGGAITLSVGGGLVVASIIRYIVVSRR